MLCLKLLIIHIGVNPLVHFTQARKLFLADLTINQQMIIMINGPLEAYRLTQ